MICIPVSLGMLFLDDFASTALHPPSSMVPKVHFFFFSDAPCLATVLQNAPQLKSNRVQISPAKSACKHRSAHGRVPGGQT